MKSPFALLLLTAFWACLTSGCITPCATSGGLPSDFALTFVVHTDTPTAQPADRGALFILEPDRTFRVAFGPGLTANLFPPMLSRLTPEQLQTIFTLIQQRQLLAEPTSPRAEALIQSSATGLLYEVHIAGCAQTHRFFTTPDESPPTRALLNMLIQMASGPSSP